MDTRRDTSDYDLDDDLRTGDKEKEIASRLPRAASVEILPAHSSVSVYRGTTSPIVSKHVDKGDDFGVSVNHTSGSEEKLPNGDCEDAKAPGRVEDVNLVEGGLSGWATVVGAMILQFAGFGYVNAFGVFEDFYVRQYLPSYSSSQISWIGSMQLFLTMAMGLVAGRWFDRGYFMHMAVAGSVLVSLALFMLSLAKPDKYYQIFLSQGLLLGLGSGLTYIPTLSVVSHHFRSPGSRALAMGLVASGSSLGGLVHPIMLNNLFHGSHSIGFGRSVRASAGMVLGMEALALVLVKTDYPKYVREGSEPAGRGQVALTVALKKFATDWKYVMMIMGMMLYAQGLFFPIFYLQLDALKHGLDSTFAFYSLSILNGSSILGRILPGLLARHFKLNVFNMLNVCDIICAILIFSMLGVKTVGGVATFAVLYGGFSGALISLLAPNLALLADHPSEIGARMGICFAFTGIGALIGNPVNGALLTSQYHWWRPIVYSGTMCVAGSTAIMASKILLSRQKNAESCKEESANFVNA